MIRAGTAPSLKVTISFIALVLVNVVVVRITLPHLWADWPTAIADRLLGYHDRFSARSASWFLLLNSLALVQAFLLPVVFVLPATLFAAYLRLPWWASLVVITTTFGAILAAPDNWRDWPIDLIVIAYTFAVLWPSLFLAFIVYFIARGHIELRGRRSIDRMQKDVP